MITITLTIRWKLWALILSLTLLVGGGLWFISERVAVLGVYIEGHRVMKGDIGGIRQTLEKMVAEPIEIIWEGHGHRFHLSELGVEADIPFAVDTSLASIGMLFHQRLIRLVRRHPMDIHIEVPVTVQHDILRQRMLDTFRGIESEPVDARLSGIATNHVIAGKDGLQIDVEALAHALTTTVWSAEGREIRLPLRSVPPRIRTEDLEAWDTLHVVGSEETFFDPTQKGRSDNIRLGAKTIDGIVLLPGDAFSFNEATGERTAEAGYQEAPVIIEGRLVPGIGGGVSQLASTVFNAALRAGLHITEYHSHSQPVPYLPVGRDATVWDGQLDLQFINTLQNPIVINAETGPASLHVAIRSPGMTNQRVDITTEVIERLPIPIEEQSDPHGSEARRLLQQGREGQRIAVIQNVYEGDRLVVRRRLEAVYLPRAEIWAVGSN